MRSLYMEVFNEDTERVEKFMLLTKALPLIFLTLMCMGSLYTSPRHLFFLMLFTTFCIWFVALGWTMFKANWERETGGRRPSKKLDKQLRWLNDNTDWEIDDFTREYFHIQKPFENFYKTVDTWEYRPNPEKNWWER